MCGRRVPWLALSGIPAVKRNRRTTEIGKAACRRRSSLVQSSERKRAEIGLVTRFCFKFAWMFVLFLSGLTAIAVAPLFQ
jgi:hypothetical protein